MGESGGVYVSTGTDWIGTVVRNRVPDNGISGLRRVTCVFSTRRGTHPVPERGGETVGCQLSKFSICTTYAPRFLCLVWLGLETKV